MPKNIYFAPSFDKIDFNRLGLRMENNIWIRLDELTSDSSEEYPLIYSMVKRKKFHDGNFIFKEKDFDQLRDEIKKVAKLTREDEVLIYLEFLKNLTYRGGNLYGFAE